MTARLQLLIDSVKDRYNNGDPSHDFVHIQRVMKTCQQVGETVGADMNILLPAALLHDVVNVPKNSPDRARASEMAANEARVFLEKAGYSFEEIKKISVVIVEHSYSLGLQPSCIESAVLQDADRLDALGAHGIMRTITVGGKFGSSYYNEIEPVPRTRELNDKKYSLDHFYVKLFKLAERMNTEPAKQEAQRRVKFMNDFIEQLQTEIP